MMWFGNRWLRLLLPLVLALGLAAGPARAESLQAIYDRFQKFYGVGNYDAALIEIQNYEAAVRRREGTASRCYAVALNNLALLYDNQGRYAEAEPLYKRALAIWEKALGPDHPEVAMGLNNLGNLYEDQGRYGEAEPLSKRALAIQEKALGPDHPEVGKYLNNLATL